MIDDHAEERESESFRLPSLVENSGPLLCCVWSIISLVHSVFYVLSWDTQLPTGIERIIWKVCTVVVISLGPVIVHATDALWYDGYTPLASSGVSKKAILRAYTTVIVVFAFARIYMLVETLRELLYLPPRAFTVASWSEYLPYFS